MVPMMRSLSSMPSMVKLFSVSSWPFTEKPAEGRRSSGRAPVVRPLPGPSLAPGTICTSCTKLRPFSGKSCTALAVTVELTTALSACSSGVDASTVTVSLDPPVCSTASSRARSPASTAMPVSLVELKPVSSTVKE